MQFQRVRVWRILLMILWAGWPLLAGAQSSPPAPTAERSPIPVATPDDGEPSDVRVPEPATAHTVSTPTLRLLRTLETFHADVKTIQASFTQVRVDEIFMDQVESEGRLWFRKPYHFRCDYHDPHPIVNLIVNMDLYIYVEELEEVDHWRFESEQQRNQNLHQLLIGFGFDTEHLVRRYRIRCSEDDAQLAEQLREQGKSTENNILFEIQPRPATKETCPFSVLRVTIDKASLLPEKIWYRDLSEATMTLLMDEASIKLDQPIEDKVFDPERIFPPDVTFIEKQNVR